MTPMGSGCYHICPNSDHFYSPQQEREDDLNFSRADYDREVYGDPDLDAEYEEDYSWRGDDGGDDDWTRVPMQRRAELDPPLDFDRNDEVCASYRDDEIPF